MRPFPSSFGNKYILVVVEYIFKWLELTTFPTNDAKVVCRSLKNLFATFGYPRVLISDRGTHHLEIVLKRYGVHHRLSIAYHPQQVVKLR